MADLRYYYLNCWMRAVFEKLKTWPVKLSLILNYAVCLYIGGKNQSSARYTQWPLGNYLSKEASLPESAIDRRKQFRSRS